MPARKITNRPKYCEPGSLSYIEAGRRTRVSRRLLMQSELATRGQAWRLWAVCNEQTASFTRASDLVYIATLARNAGLEPKAASPILHQFDAEGIFHWKGAPPGSHLPGILTLPMHEPHEDGSQKFRAGAPATCRLCTQPAYQEGLCLEHWTLGGTP